LASVLSISHSIVEHMAAASAAANAPHGTVFFFLVAGEQPIS